MCGICGVVSFGSTPDAVTTRRMMGRLAHRGPDGSGYYRDENAALGHVRLAIIDLPGGAQPMANEDGTVWVTFNGEIFNYLELGEQLRRLGHRFRTSCDTEVIVHAWEEWGADCFSRFNGQWALALWDRRNRRLVLSRDRMGVRPLFYARQNGRVLFASEVKALFADPAVSRELDPAGLGQVFTFWSTVAPQTVFRGVEQLEPGCYAVVDEGGFRTQPYWTPSFPDQGEEPVQEVEQNTRRLRDGLIAATQLRFDRSDVPVGAYLSGGLDSSVTAAVLARHTNVPLRTFSLRFRDAEFDEGDHQRAMARRLGTEHQEVLVTASDIAAVFPDVVWHAETPILRAAPAPMYLLSKLVHDSGYRVVVTGEGADEVLAGYDIFREASVRRFWARAPASAKRARAVELLYPWMTRSPGSAPAFARSFFGRNLDPADPALSHRPRWDATRALQGLLLPELQQRVATDPAATVIERLPASWPDWDPLSLAQWFEITTLLPGYILSSQGDRMLMAHSVEGRFPFLDRDVVELANSLPARQKLMGLDEKHLLKRAFADLVPPEILSRDKQPYRAPDATSFFSGSEPAWWSDVNGPEAIRAAGVFDESRVSRLFDKCRRTEGRDLGNTDNMRVLAVVSTQILYRRFVAETSPPGPEPPPQPMTVVDLVTGEGATASGT